MIQQKRKFFYFAFFTSLVIFLFFFPTIFFKVKAYDELMTFKETYLPVCLSFSEMFELISVLGLRHHFEATNTIYSSLVSIRCNPVGNFLLLLVQALFKKNPINYHLYSLFLHLINSYILFYLLTKIRKLFNNNKGIGNIEYGACSLLVLIWALHPVNLESVLLLSNANIVLSYTLTLLALVALLNKSNPLLTFVLYITALFTAEFHFFIPLLLILYLVIASNYFNKEISFKGILLKTSPFLLASLIFIISFLLSPTKLNLSNQSNIQIILERIFWLSPQILFHFTQLFLFPVNLSIDQTNLVRLGKTLFDPYVVFCFFAVFFFVLLSILSILSSKKRLPLFFLTFTLFLLTLIPFSQILAPIYNLASERYLYFPSFMFIFGLGHVLFYLDSKNSTILRTKIIYLLSIILLIYGGRSYLRTLDWKDSESLYRAAIRSTNNPLHQAVRYKGLSPQESVLSRFPEREVSVEIQRIAENKLEEAIVFYKSEVQKYQDKTPLILKAYGLDPETLLVKSGYVLSQTKFTLNKDDYKLALETIQPYLYDLSKLDSAALTFYASILYFNNQIDQSEYILRKALELHPYSTKIIYPLCDLIQIKYGDLNQIEELTLKAFKYFPYDSFTLLVLTKVYSLKGDLEKFAHYSYIFGLRNHSIEDLTNAYNAYIKLNEPEKANKVKEKILFLRRVLHQ